MAAVFDWGSRDTDGAAVHQAATHVLLPSLSPASAEAAMEHLMPSPHIHTDSPPSGM